MREGKIPDPPDGLEVLTLACRPDLQPLARALDPAVLPRFITHDAMVGRYWNRLYDVFPDFQIAVCEGEEVVASGNCIPVSWGGTVEGLPSEVLDAVLEQGMLDASRERSPTAVSALFAVVSREHQGRGLSRVVLGAMKAVVAEHGLGDLIAPVRPTLKERYPLTPMERYVEWVREDRLPFDPWLRVHRRMVSEILRVAPRSMLVTGTISEWEEWTDMRFPDSGEYVIPGALQPVVMDVGEDVETYEEPNVWVRHVVRPSEEGGEIAPG